jgi:hypothetical protein
MLMDYNKVPRIVFVIVLSTAEWMESLVTMQQQYCLLYNVQWSKRKYTVGLYWLKLKKIYLIGHVAANVGRRGFCPKHCQEWSIMWFSMHLSLFFFGMWYDIACKWKQQIPLKCVYLAHLVFHPRRLPSNIFVFTYLALFIFSLCTRLHGVTFQ